MELLNRKLEAVEARAEDAGVTSILAIIVVYKMLPSESPSLNTLLQAARVASPLPLRLSILVVDNTPGGQEVGSLPLGVRYLAAPDNPGLARPYNEALTLAAAEGFTWLLTLDQDTSLPETFLASLERYARQYHSLNQVGAIVPHVLDNERLISPFRFIGGFFPRVLSSDAHGISGRFTSAINSASLLRVKALRELGGYDPEFPLNNSDTSLFHRLDQAGRRVAIADICVQHELAILQRQDRMTPERYRQLLVDEREFWDRHMGFLARAERLIRLIGRFCKSYFHNEDARFRKITSAEIGLRLLRRRDPRIRQQQPGADVK